MTVSVEVRNLGFHRALENLAQDIPREDLRSKVKMLQHISDARSLAQEACLDVIHTRKELENTVAELEKVKATVHVAGDSDTFADNISNISPSAFGLQYLLQRNTQAATQLYELEKANIELAKKKLRP